MSVVVLDVRELETSQDAKPEQHQCCEYRCRAASERDRNESQSGSDSADHYEHRALSAPSHHVQMLRTETG